MTKFQKRIAIISLAVTIISAIVIPIVLKIMDNKEREVIPVTPDGRVMIEQRIIGPGGGGGDVEVTKTVKIRATNN